VICTFYWTEEANTFLTAIKVAGKYEMLFALYFTVHIFDSLVIQVVCTLLG